MKFSNLNHINYYSTKNRFIFRIFDPLERQISMIKFSQKATLPKKPSKISSMKFFPQQAI